MKEIASNKKAYHEYEITDRFEAGIVLNGAEIKAIRAGKVNLTGSHAKILNQAPRDKKKETNNAELFLINLHIGIKEGDPTRTRKLLMTSARKGWRGKRAASTGSLRESLCPFKRLVYYNRHSPHWPGERPGSAWGLAPPYPLSLVGWS